MNKIISVILPVRNEAKNLPKSINAIKVALSKVNLEYEIITVINRCEDNSEEVAKLLDCITTNTTGNLSQIRNAGAKIAKGDYLYFIDADSLMHKNTFIKTLPILEKSVGGATWIIPERFSLGIFFTFLMLTPFVFIHGLSGGMFFCRKESFLKVNGFDENVFSAEDLDFSRRLKEYGKKINLKYRTLYSIPITTSCRKFDHFGDWFFLKHPIMFYKLLKNNDKEAASLIWYNFKNK